MTGTHRAKAEKLLRITSGFARLGISETKFPIEATSTPILQNHLLYDVVFSKSDGKTQFEKLY